MPPFEQEKQTLINQPNIMPKFCGLSTLSTYVICNDQLREGSIFTKKEKYLCADAQFLRFQSSPSRNKILCILAFASTEVGKRKAWEGIVFYSNLLNDN